MTLFGLFDTFFFLLAKTWFIWAPFTLFFAALESWLSYVQTRYKKAIEWTLLEIKIPREVRRSPRAMEQFFASIYALRNEPGPGFPTTLKEKYLDGEVTLWFSLEMASFGGEIHFYLRTPAKHKNVIEANLYAQYPDIEIIEADDYISRMPAGLPELYQSGFDLAGGEFKTGKPDPYPIATYLKFETAQEEYQLDPISALMEIFGKLRPEEDGWLQILIRPADPNPKTSHWKKQVAETIEELRKKGAKEVSVGDEGQTMTYTPLKTPGETAVIKAIEESVLKSGFEVVIRWLYFAPQSIFNKDVVQRGIAGALNQYASGGLNFFVPSLASKTAMEWHNFPYVFPKYRTAVRKKELLKKYQERSLPEETILAQWSAANFWRSRSVFVLNTEELATIYHLPSHLVLTAPFVRRVEAKRAGPPAGLPLFEE